MRLINNSTAIIGLQIDTNNSFVAHMYVSITQDTYIYIHSTPKLISLASLS